MKRSSRNRRHRPPSSSRLVAAMMRTSTLRVRGVTDAFQFLYSCKTRNNFACIASGASPISSRNKVPPSANSNRPGLSLSAPVNALSRDRRIRSRTGSLAGATIHFDERTVLSRAVVVNGPGDEFFAGTAFSGDDTAACRGRDELNLLHHFPQTRTSPTMSQKVFLCGFLPRAKRSGLGIDAVAGEMRVWQCIDMNICACHTHAGTTQ